MDDREKIRNEVSIVDTISEYTKLKKTGSSWTGLCPFHNDKNPSFSVSEDKGLYNCFACGASGDIFKFIQEKQNLDFSEALHYLAEKHNIQLTGKREKSKKSYFEVLENLNDWLIKVFQDSDYGKPFRGYMEKRGFDHQWCKEYGIGAFPPQGQLLKSYILKKTNLEKKIFLEVGLISKAKNKWEPLAGRISFPIRDNIGRIRGFSARILNDKNKKIAKYKNSIESEIFKKSQLLYNWHNAKKSKGPLILCEGQSDVLRFEKEGIKGAVASMGTAFSEDHAYMVKRVKDKAVVVMDGDDKGLIAASKAIGRLLKAGIEPLVVIPPQKKDPDEWLKEEGKKGWDLATKQDALDFYLNQIIEEENNLKTEISKQRAIEKIKPLIKDMNESISKQQIIEKISQKFMLPKHLVTTEIETSASNSQKNKTATKNKFLVEEEEVFRYLFKNPTKWKIVSEIFKKYKVNEFQSQKIKNIYFVMNTIDSADPELIMKQFEGEEKSFIAECLISERETTLYDMEEIIKMIILKNLKEERRVISMSAKKDRLKTIDKINKTINNISQEGVPGWNEL
mgnify:CR=1 FL=1